MTETLKRPNYKSRKQNDNHIFPGTLHIVTNMNMKIVTNLLKRCDVKYVIKIV